MYVGPSIWAANSIAFTAFKVDDPMQHFGHVVQIQTQIRYLLAFALGNCVYGTFFFSQRLRG